MRFLLPLLILLSTTGMGAAQTTDRDVMVVFDMSGSMWGQVDGVAKVEIARNAFDGLLEDWQANNTQAGLIAYGHRERGNCADIETLAVPGDGADIAALVAGMSPKGKTPLSDAVRQAAEVLKFTEEAATVVLLSDGVETCDADPCAVGAQLEALGLDFTAHVIGFDIAEGDKAQLQCLANATGGQYFDAADARELSEAMDGVVQATAVEAPEELRGQDFQTVTLRVKMDSMALSLPDEITIYGNDIELGTLTDDTAAHPGLLIEMPFGEITLRVEGLGVSDEMLVDVTDQTEFIDLAVSGAEADYVLWRVGQFPVLDNKRSNMILIKNTTGVDRGSFYPLYLYPSGSTDPAQGVKIDNLSPTAGIYIEAEIPSDVVPGDYDLVPTGTDGTQYARIPISFASGIDPVWQGTRAVEAGGMLDAYWAGSSDTFDQFRFMQGEDAVSRHRVSSLATKDGFKLPAPTEPGLYELVYISEYVNNFEFQTTSMGMIAVGVPLPVADPDGLAEEAEAMGGEEGPLPPVGELHGNWVLMARNDAMNVPLARFQVAHDQGTDFAEGDFVIEAPEEWNLGPQGSSGTSGLGIIDDTTRMLTFVGKTGTQTVELKRDGNVWRAPTDMVAQHSGITLDVMVLRSDDLAGVDTAPVVSYLQAYDERGTKIAGPVAWDLSLYTAGTFDQMRTETGLNSTQRAQGTYEVTATAGSLTGTDIITVSRSSRANNAIILRTDGEGDTLPMDVAYYCSAGEDCDMFEPDYAVSFTLPEGWGAQKALRSRNWGIAFDMATLTPDGVFYATLNDPNRSGNVGPCYDVIAGELCHATTKDPKLLADIDTIRRGLSVKSVGEPLDQDDIDTLLNELTGTSK
ncbi:vWA domain-containing protein [Yoonia sp. MH D7]